MRKGFLLLLVFWIVSVDSFAQSANESLPNGRLRLAESDQHSDVGTDLRMPGRMLIPSFDRQRPSHSKRSSALSAHRRSVDIGDTLSFNTPQFLFTGWQNRTFVLADTTASFALWVENDEIQNGHVSPVHIDSMMAYLDGETPSGSYDPSMGLYSNTIALYGGLPDVDGDDKLDILWYDIRDEYPSSSNFIPSMALYDDIDSNSGPDEGNAADVIYVDTDPLLIGSAYGSKDVAGATAVAMQRLIHLGRDPDESDFIFSGLADFAGVVNGFEGAGNIYLEFSGEHNIPLFSFEGFLGDVQRSSLFVNYLFEQLGAESLAALTADTSNGERGIENIIGTYGAGRSLNDFILDFHTANLINDTELDAKWGYFEDDQANLRVAPSARFDASLANIVQDIHVDIEAGGVQYLLIENVSDITISLDADLPGDASKLGGNLVGYGIDGSITIEAVEIGTPTQMFGQYEGVVLVYTNSEIDTSAVATTVSASWTGTAYPTTNIVYGDGTLSTTGNNHIQLGAGFKQATFLPNPDGYLLTRLQISPFFLNQFIDDATGVPFGTPTDARDISLCIAPVGASGDPGDCLVEETIVDPRPWSLLSTSNPQINFITLDLAPFAEDLDGAGDVFVVFSEAGSDDNVLVLSMATYDVENVSYLFGPIGGPAAWFRLWDISIGGVQIANRMVDIRGQFQDRPVITSIDAPIIPIDPKLLPTFQSYPNPFNENSRVDLQLPNPSNVTLEVFDMLGRRVAILADDRYPAGNHTFYFTPDNLPSGVYLYRATLDEAEFTRSVIYIK